MGKRAIYGWALDKFDRKIVATLQADGQLSNINVDLMLEIIAVDMEHYSQVVLRDVFDTKGVNATRSSCVLTEVKSIY